jgi:hypothetical protein
MVGKDQTCRNLAGADEAAVSRLVRDNALRWLTCESATT